MKALGTLTAAILWMAAAAMINGWTLARLWLWIMVPTFELKPISLASAIGLALVISFTTEHIKASNDKENTKSMGECLREIMFGKVLKAAFALLIGCVVKVWI